MKSRARIVADGMLAIRRLSESETKATKRQGRAAWDAINAVDAESAEFKAAVEDLVTGQSGWLAEALQRLLKKSADEAKAAKRLGA